MTPREQAALVYTKEPCARTFAEDMQLHLQNGFVFDHADFFVMGRPVFSKCPREMLVDPRVRFTRDICDAWMIYLMAGDCAKAWSIMPWPLPRFVFERKNELRVYDSARIQRLCLPTVPPATPAQPFL